MVRFLICLVSTTYAIGMLSCSGPRLSTTNEKAIQSYRLARSFEKKHGTRLNILEAYIAAIDADPEFIEAYVALGEFYDRAGNYAKAYENYGKALGIDPGNSVLYLNYGKALFNAGRYEDAYTYLDLYHSKYPTDLDGLEWLAEAARVARRASAESLLGKLTATDSSNASGWLGLARFHFELGEYERAALAYGKYVALEKDVDDQTRMELVECLIRLGDWAGAKSTLISSAPMAEDLRIAVDAVQKKAFDPTAMILYYDAKRHFEMPTFDGDGEAYGKVLSLLSEAKSLEPAFIPVRQELAALAYAIGKDSTAIEEYHALDSAGRATAADLINLAFLYFKQDNLIEAAKHYEASLALDSTQQSVRDYLVTIRKIIDGKLSLQAYRAYEKGIHASGRDSSEFFLRQAISMDSTYYEAYLQLGTVLMRGGKNREANKAFERGLGFVSDSAVANYFMFQMGVNYFQMDYHDKAIAAFEAVLLRDSTDADALSYLSRTYADKSDMKNAVVAYDRLVMAAPDFFSPSSSDMKDVGLSFEITKDTTRVMNLTLKSPIGLTCIYKLKIMSKNGALLDADANGDQSREMEVTFREQVVDITEWDESEIALDILKVNGYALTSKEKMLEGQRLYLRMSDVFGVTNIYGLMEDHPYSLSRLVIWIMETVHGSFIRKRVAEGETWKTRQYVYKLGTVDGVGVLTDVGPRRVRGSKYYGILGSYDAARYGEMGQITVRNKGRIAFEIDLDRQIMTSMSNEFTTRSFHESNSKLDVQEARCELILLGSTVERIEKPRKVVLEKIPYVKQHGPQCAAASLSMVLSYYEENIDQDDIYAAIKSDYAGAQSWDIISYPRSLKSFKTFGYAGTLEDLKERIDQGIPVIVFLTPFGYGHAVVVIGYDESKHQIIMHDPTVANNQAVPYDDFLKEWRQSGNECAIVIPFDREIKLGEGAIASNAAVETKWQGDKAFGERNYEKAMAFYVLAAQKMENYEGALEGRMLVHLSRDEFTKAEVILDTLLGLNPTSIDLILKRASLLLSQYDYDKVLQLTRKAKQLDESNIVNFLYTASALFAQKKYDEAIQEAKQAIRLNPLQSTPRNMLAGFLAETGDFDQAFAQVALSMKYEPENVGNFLNLSGLYITEINNRFLRAGRRRANIQKALEAIDAIRLSNPNFPNLDQLYADIYAAAGEHRLSDSLYRENIRKFPEENSAYNNLAWHMAVASRQLNEARQLSEKSIELSQRNPYYFDTMAWIHLKMAIEHLEKSRQDSSDFYLRLAESELSATIEYDKYSDFAYRHLGIAYLKWGRSEDAKAQFEIVESMLPDKARVWTEIAQDCEELGLKKPALEYYLRALEYKANSAFAAGRAAFLIATTEPEQLSWAVDLIERSLNEDSTNYLYRATRGVVAFAGGDYLAAQEWIGKALNMIGAYPDDEMIPFYYFLGAAYDATKDSKSCQSNLEMYLKLAPDGSYATDARRLLKKKK